ncbi:hypothetical protein LOTGIDRAFT_235465 [Lottia gigantea]|uniref:Uncharacterized protein n=1 Tax=Lottia gigantea TaxID=225164 RepID=V3Z6N2_LOTGI|nr:hypothetical protein LOTGIDRAFT_235465 [Lottia gigantea]ESO86438.1 hypothetical protein LOTGIDRAFT_235465 [Lottia gigantea]
MKVLVVFLLFGASFGKYPRQITAPEFLDHYISGSSLAYSINHEKCKEYPNVNNITLYSFTSDILYGYVTVHPSKKWLFSYGFDQEVDGKHLNLSGPALRYTGFTLDDSGDDAIIGLNDVNPKFYKSLARAQMYCSVSQGLTLTARTPKGVPLTTFNDIRNAIKAESILYYAFDYYQCSPKTLPNSSQWFAGRIFGTRMSPKGKIVFSSRTVSLGFVTVLQDNMLNATPD